MIRKICPKCASVAWKDSDEKCRFCESSLIKLTFLQSIKLSSINNLEEKYLYITQEILNNELDATCVKIRDEKINKAKKEYNEYIKQQEAQREKKNEKKFQHTKINISHFLKRLKIKGYLVAEQKRLLHMLCSIICISYLIVRHVVL